MQSRLTELPGSLAKLRAQWEQLSASTNLAASLENVRAGLAAVSAAHAELQPLFAPLADGDIRVGALSRDFERLLAAVSALTSAAASAPLDASLVVSLAAQATQLLERLSALQTQESPDADGDGDGDVRCSQATATTTADEDAPVAAASSAMAAGDDVDASKKRVLVRATAPPAPGSTVRRRQQQQQQQQQERNAHAVAVWRKVRSRLEGREGRDGGRRAVATQVSQLIGEATSEDNLCAMFEGWSAWI